MSGYQYHYDNLECHQTPNGYQIHDHITFCVIDNPTCVLFAGHSRAVDLIQKAAAAAADPGAAAGDKDQAPDERRASHPVDRDRHVLEVRPFIGARVVDVVIGEDSGLLFATPDMEAAARHDAVDTAPGLEHWRRDGPSLGLGVEDLVDGGLVAPETAAETTADHMDFAGDGGAGDMVALARHVGKGFPFIGLGIVDGKIVTVWRTATGDVDLTVDNDRNATAALSRHPRLLFPFSCLGIEFVDRFDKAAPAARLGLATDGMIFPFTVTAMP